MATDALRRMAGLSIVALALAAGACSSGRKSEWWASAPEQRAAGATAVAPAPVDISSPSIAAALEQLGPVGKAFHAHVTTLSNPFFEGRAPGTRGIELAAEYVRTSFARSGLEPAFQPAGGSAGADGMMASAGYFDEFFVPGDPKINKAELSVAGAGAFEVGKDFNPLAISANGSVTGPLVFCGYGIEEGKDGYTSFGENVDLKGKVALVLRFEPMDDRGHSLWDSDSWSFRAAMLPKVRAALKRGASAVIVANTPGAEDKRAASLMSLDNSRIGGKVDAPVVMASADAADAMVRALDPMGRTLLDLRALADRGAVRTLELAGGTAGSNVTLTTDIDVPKIGTNNVAGVLPGRGALKDQWLVIGAHYDHIGYGRFSSRTPDHAGEVHAGADDNASGTAALLVLADELTEAYAKLPEGEGARSVLFIAFSAEEMGLVGSKDFVQNPSVPLDRVQAMLNMDMVGRLRKDGLEINGVGTAEGLKDIVERYAASSGVPYSTRPSGAAPTDQASFVEAKTPVLGFFTGIHPEYHSVYDVGSTINHAGAVRVIGLIEAIAMDLATRPEKLVYKQIDSPGRGAGPRMANMSVRLGVQPGNYTDTEPGVVVGGVSPGTTAEKGGVLKGDRIVRWGGEELANVQAMMERLASHKPGDKVEIVVVRDGKEVPLQLVMQGRDGAK